MGLAFWRDWFPAEINDDETDWQLPEDPFDPTAWFDTVTFTAAAPWFFVDDEGNSRMLFTDGTTLDVKRNGESVVKW